jgi:hypothetical protein
MFVRRLVLFISLQGIGHNIPHFRLLDAHGQSDLLRDGVQGRQDAQGGGHAKSLLDASLAEELRRHARNTLQDGEVSAASRAPLGPRRVQRSIFNWQTIRQAHARTQILIALSTT